MQDAKEEIRSRLNIEDVIGEYVHLKRAGRSLKGLSPFQDEKTPSFMVSPDKHVWYDFSSNQGGDMYSFIMLVEGLDFRGAIELLARKAGVDLSLYQNIDSGLAKKKARLLKLMEVAAQYYQQTLLKNKHALDYVTKTRGLNKKSIQNFTIGYAPDSVDSVLLFLRKKGYSQDEIKEAGMLNRAYKDLFRGRIMLPLCDSAGQVIGFTGRLIADDPKAPKYLNTPQTILYDKSRHVYGLHLAKEAIRKLDQAVVVEGNLDVVSSHQAGVTQVVATAGTALTEQHLNTVKRFSHTIALAFDNDRAGIAATERAIEISQKLGIQITIVNMPEGYKDPDELLQKDATLWKKSIEKSIAAVDWVLLQYEKRVDIRTAEGKRRFSTAGLDLVSKLLDPVEKEHYIRHIAKILDTSVSSITEKLSSIDNQEDQSVHLKKISQPKEVENVPAHQVNQDKLLSIGVYDPKVRGLLIEIHSSDLETEEQQLVLQYLKTNPDVDLQGDIPAPLRDLETYVKILLLRADERYKQWNDIDRYDETARLVKLVKQNARERNKQHLIKDLKLAEQQGNEQKVTDLQQQLNTIIKEN